MTPSMSLARFLLPPVNRLMPALDRGFFKKTVPLTAARIFDQSQLPTIRQRIEIDLLEEKRFQTRIQIGKATESEVLVLRPQVRFDGKTERKRERVGGFLELWR